MMKLPILFSMILVGLLQATNTLIAAPPPDPAGIAPEPVATHEPSVSGVDDIDQELPADPADLKEICPMLNGLVIVSQKNQIQPEGRPEIEGLQVIGIPLLAGEDFAAVVTPYLGQSITIGDIKRLQRDIILYARRHNRTVVDVILPEQAVEGGVIQLWFLEGRYGRFFLYNPDENYLSDERIRATLHARSGAVIETQQLLDDLDWLNRNPFRHVDVVLRQGDTLGEVDLVLNVQDRRPLRLYGGFEDSGTPFSGENRLITGLNWGNAFGLDHQVNYQFTTDTDFDLIAAHSASYFAPLPWRHTAILFGSYVDAETDFGSLTTAGGDGESFQLSGRYLIPLPRMDLSTFTGIEQELTLGFDFKQSDNDLLSGGLTVINADVDLFQFMGGYSAARSDSLGRSTFGFEVYWSPSGLTNKNQDDDYQKLRAGAEAEYLYSRLTAERVTRLPAGFSWIIRGTGQLSTERLLPTEEMGFGGYRTARGYDEREASADEGWLLTNEIRTPPLKMARLIRRAQKRYDLDFGDTAPPATEDKGDKAWPGDLDSSTRQRPEIPDWNDQLQFLLFWDYGQAHPIRPVEFSEDPHVIFSSVGFGFRFTLDPHVSIRFDYGWQLKDSGVGTNPDSSRAHVAVLISY